jgi:hypothetical protein
MASSGAALRFLHEAGLQAHFGAVDFAVDVVVAVDQANVFSFGALFEYLR